MGMSSCQISGPGRRADEEMSEKHQEQFFQYVSKWVIYWTNWLLVTLTLHLST